MRPGNPDDDNASNDPEAPLPAGPVASAQWRVDRSMVVLKFVGAIAFAIIPQILGLNSASRLFGLGMCLVLAIYAFRDVAAPIRLSADAEGLTVIHGYAGHRRLAWSQIDRIRVDSRRRAEFLEVDSGETLHLFSRYDLSMPPTEALATLEKIRP